MPFRVSHKDLLKGARIESAEHPGFSPRQTRTIAMQHIQRYGSGYYRMEPIFEKLIRRSNMPMHIHPLRRQHR